MKKLVLSLSLVAYGCSKDQGSRTILNEDVSTADTKHCSPDSIVEDSSSDKFMNERFRCKVAEWISYYGNVKRHEKRLKQMTVDRRLGHLSRWRAEYQASLEVISHNNVNERYVWFDRTYGKGALGGQRLVENGIYLEFFDAEMQAFETNPSELAKILINKWMTSSGHRASLMDAGNKSNGAGFVITRPRPGVYGLYGIHSFTY